MFCVCLFVCLPFIYGGHSVSAWSFSVPFTYFTLENAVSHSSFSPSCFWGRSSMLLISQHFKALRIVLYTGTHNKGPHKAQLKHKWTRASTARFKRVWRCQRAHYGKGREITGPFRCMGKSSEKDVRNGRTYISTAAAAETKLAWHFTKGHQMASGQKMLFILHRQKWQL